MKTFISTFILSPSHQLLVTIEQQDGNKKNVKPLEESDKFEL